MCRRVIILLIACLAFIIQGLADEPRYPLSGADSSLFRHASMIVRVNDVSISIRSLEEEVIRTRYAVTILKESAAKAAIFKLYYDDDCRIGSFEGSMYNAEGRLIRRFKKEDIMDLSAIGDGILYSDHRVKVIRPMLNSYPVTVEYESEITIRRILYYPSFEPQEAYDQSVEYARLEVTASPGLFPRCLELRLPSSVVKTGDGTTRMQWEFRNLRSVTEEPLSPSFTARVPVILLGPVSYGIEEYRGDFSSWTSMGQWIGSLNEGRDTLLPATCAVIQKIAAAGSTPEEKARILYRHLQQTTRYVAVELGIGGLQPESAETVAQLGYGDCKGLVNYMGAMLRCAGIPSRQVLVRAGGDAEHIRTDFPGNQFNHVILAVLLGRDTVWLECTSQHLPFGYTGKFTSDRTGLMIGPAGGTLVRTPSYGMKENTLQRRLVIMPDSAGNARVEAVFRHSGMFFDEFDELLSLPEEKRKEEIIERFRIPGLHVESYGCEVTGERLPVMTERFSLRIEAYATVSGKRLFLPSGKLMGILKSYVADSSRQCPLALRQAYRVFDTVTVRIPPGYRLETTGTDQEITGPFGMLSTRMRADGRDVIYTRSFERGRGEYPPEMFNEYAGFTRQVTRQEQKKLVLVRE